MIGENIKKYRKQCTMTQQELANILEYTQAYISYLEDGKREIKISILEKMTLIFDCKLKDLLKGWL